jgi:hypothetical protein
MGEGGEDGELIVVEEGKQFLTPTSEWHLLAPNRRLGQQEGSEIRLTAERRVR